MKNTIQHPTRGRLVCRIWDNGGETIDRYMAVFKARRVGSAMYWPYLGASERPFHPLGFGQHGEFDNWQDAKGGAYLGKRIAFDVLPADVQAFILQSI